MISPSKGLPFLPQIHFCLGDCEAEQKIQNVFAGIYCIMFRTNYFWNVSIYRYVSKFYLRECQTRSLHWLSRYYMMGLDSDTISWWCRQMETFSALLALCERNSPVTGEFPSQRPVTRSFDVFYDLRLNKRLSKQSWGWWFEIPSRQLWHYCNAHKKRKSYYGDKTVVGLSYLHNRSISQIPECTCSISHNAPSTKEMCTFLFWMEHCGIWNRCILGFVN